MLTDRQITNRYNNAASDAYRVTSASMVEHFAASEAQLIDERGNAQCAAGFAAQAIAKLANNDYEGFLSSMRLAGAFAEKASAAYYTRKPL